MSVDTRAYAWCNLGPLADGTTTIAESHVQGSGVVTYRGTVNLAGIYRPAPGTIVSLAYSDGQNWLARLPLRLRVLSSFANPLSGSRVTSISVGCDLAYFENRKQPPTVLKETEENPDTPAATKGTRTPRMSAAWIVGKILTNLGLAASGPIPLTNRYLLSTFDLTSGYISELGRLCASESYLARMNAAGQVEFIYKNPGIGTSALITEEDLIDLNPINSGELAGEAIYSRYRMPKLKPPQVTETPGGETPGGETPGGETPESEAEREKKKRNWELTETVSEVLEHIHSYNTYKQVPALDANGNQRYEQRVDENGNKQWNCVYMEVSEYGKIYLIPLDCAPLNDPVFTTEVHRKAEHIQYIIKTTTRTEYDEDDYAIRRYTVTDGLWGEETSETIYKYAKRANAKSSVPSPSGGAPGRPLGVGELRGDAQENQAEKQEKDLIYEETVEVSPVAPVMISAGYELPYLLLKNHYGTYRSSFRSVEYTKDEASGATKTVTRQMIPYSNTPAGAEAISRLRDTTKRGSDEDDKIRETIVELSKRLVYYGGESQSSVTETKTFASSPEIGVQKRPSEANRLKVAYEKGVDSKYGQSIQDNSKDNPAVENVEKILWAVGSASSQTAIELTPPYYSDPAIIYTGSEYRLSIGDAPQKIRTYATTENRLLLGHRNGVGIQVLPELLPPAPMGLVYIRLNGCTGAFRVNGTTWNINPEGVTATTDALFWGAIDGSSVADAWFPLPPNASTLPGPVAVTVNSGAKPANAIAIPSGFNPGSPDLTALFAALPTDAAPVFPKTVTPGVYLKPWHETVNLAAGIGGGAIVTTQPWIIQPPTALAAGMGAGVTATYLRFANLYAGMGNGAIAQGMTFANLYAGMGAGAVLTNLGRVVALHAGMGAGATAERRLLLTAGAGAGAIISQAATPDPLFSQVQLLLHCNGNFADSSSTVRTIVNNGSVQFDSTHSVAGSSGYVPSGVRWLSITGGIDIPANTPATLEIWFRATSVSDFGLFGDTLTGNGQLLTVVAGKLRCYWNANDIQGGTVSANQNYYAAVTRDSSGIVRLFLDGVLVATAGAANNQAFRVSNILRAINRADYVGWFDEARITVGATGCRYVTSYTPSPIPFPNA
jgi:hypothetical protein